MLDLSVAERMLYSTFKLTALRAGLPFSTGTGFFVNFANDGKRSIPTIVTNKHVLGDSDQITANFHLAEEGRPSGKFATWNIGILPGTVFEHPDPGVDLCAIPIAGILEQASAANSPIFFQNLTTELIPQDGDWQFFDAIEEVTMIGCPRGISDEANNMPIVRRGITATSLGRLYNGKQEFMVDMACFPGSSGSPVFLYDRNGFLDRKQNSYNIGASRIHLVGILYAGPQITNSGQIILAQPASVAVAAMMHLGYVIRASQLRVLESKLKLLIPANAVT